MPGVESLSSVAAHNDDWLDVPCSTKLLDSVDRERWTAPTHLDIKCFKPGVWLNS